jgi:transketolase
MRNAFAKEITNLSADNKKIVLLSGDIGNKLFDPFKSISADNFFNCGIAEANMMGVASGMAMSGLRPIVYTITPFTTTRCLEQIRVDACYHNVPVIIVGTGSGLSYASLGPTHHSLEDFAIFRAIPNITIMAPADEIELKHCLVNALKLNSPVYIRIGKKGEPIISSEDGSFEVGKSITLKDGKDVCLIGAGTIMPEVLKASELLEEKKITCRVESFHTIKPLDKDTLNDVFSKFSVISVIEEHSKIGGLYGAISEHYASSKFDTTILSFGVQDEFMHEVGSQQYAREKYGLNSGNIYTKTLETFLNNIEK